MTSYLIYTVSENQNKRSKEIITSQMRWELFKPFNENISKKIRVLNSHSPTLKDYKGLISLSMGLDNSLFEVAENDFKNYKVALHKVLSQSRIIMRELIIFKKNNDMLFDDIDVAVIYFKIKDINKLYANFLKKFGKEGFSLEVKELFIELTHDISILYSELHSSILEQIKIIKNQVL